MSMCRNSSSLSTWWRALGRLSVPKSPFLAHCGGFATAVSEKELVLEGLQPSKPPAEEAPRRACSLPNLLLRRHRVCCVDYSRNPQGVLNEQCILERNHLVAVWGGDRHARKRRGRLP